MQKYKRLFAFALLVLATLFSNAQRQTISLNQQWNFSGASLWEESVEKIVDVPHTWNTQDAAQGYKYYRGEGVYKKKYFVDATFADKRLFLKFEGAQTVADVSVNGQHLGQHRGGYSAFAFEITDAVKFGEDNLIEVKVDNSETEDVLPLGGDFNIYGGIYRPVHLIVTEKVCITPLDFASPGVYLVQKNVSATNAQIDVVTKISNGAKRIENIDIEATVFDAAGNPVENGMSNISVEPASTGQATISISIEYPHLWNAVKDPYLYSVKVVLKKDGEEFDEVVQSLGIRYYSTDPDKGFSLNGERVKIKGVSRHNDFAGVASALTEEQHRTDMELIAEMGANGIRLAHYQHADYFYALSDTAGMMVWAEIPFVGSDQSGFHNSEAFQENAKQQLRELIRQNFNHPSVLFWGLYNEIGMKNDPALTAIIEDLHAVAKQEDPTRPTVAASFINGRSEDALHKIPEMIAWNQYYGWYYTTPDKLGDFLDKFHQEQPGYKIGISEYGAGGSIHHHEEEITRPFPIFHEWHPEEYQALVHEGNWKAIAERDFVWGSYVWNMFDFGSHFRREGDAIGINDKGMVTYDRKTKKDAFYFYKANWSDKPFVHITNARFAIRKADNIEVKVYSNLKNVELLVNGESLGSKNGDYGTHIWDEVELEKGNNVVVAKGQLNGETYTNSVVWMYEKNLGLSFVVGFLRWGIKPFIVLLIVWLAVAIWLLRKKRVKNWRKVLSVIFLVIAVLLLLVIVAGQLWGSKFGINLFEYSVI